MAPYAHLHRQTPAGVGKAFAICGFGEHSSALAWFKRGRLCRERLRPGADCQVPGLQADERARYAGRPGLAVLTVLGVFVAQHGGTERRTDGVPAVGAASWRKDRTVPRR